MKIGEALLKENLISRKQLEIALDEQLKTRERLGDITIKMGFVTTEKIAPFLASYFGLPFINLKETYRDIKPEVISIVPEELARRFILVPISAKDGSLTVAMFDPLDVIAIDTIKMRTHLKINRVVAAEKDITEALEYCYHQLPRMKEHVEEFIELESATMEDFNEDFEKLRVEASDPPVVQYVNALIVKAANSGASDIHLQSKQDTADLRFRIDGVLYISTRRPRPCFLLSLPASRY